VISFAARCYLFDFNGCSALHARFFALLPRFCRVGWAFRFHQEVIPHRWWAPADKSLTANVTLSYEGEMAKSWGFEDGSIAA
jgi:hypothetical protein